MNILDKANENATAYINKQNNKSGSSEKSAEEDKKSDSSEEIAPGAISKVANKIADSNPDDYENIDDEDEIIKKYFGTDDAKKVIFGLEKLELIKLESLMRKVKILEKNLRRNYRS
jgi:hypothetical protein